MSDLSDGKLIFKTKIDNSNIEQDLKAMERKIRSSQESISKMNNAKLPWETKFKDLGGQLDAAKRKVEDLRKELERLKETANDPSDPVAYLEAGLKIPDLEQALKENENEVKDLQKQWDKVNDKVDDYDAKIKSAEADIARYTEQSAALQEKMFTPNQVKMSESMAKAEKTAGSFGKRIRSIAASALVFNLISKGLRSMVSYMGQALKSNSEYTAQLAKMKAAWLTAFQPIYEYVLPGLIKIMQVITAIGNALAAALSFFTGKTATQSAKNAEALNKQASAIGAVGDAAQEAEKQLLGFDEINKLTSTDTGINGSGGGNSGSDTITPDFSGITDMEDQLEQILGLVAAIAAGLLTWKIASTFLDDMSKAAGLAMAVGGAVLYACNWADAFANGIDWDNLSGMLAGMTILALGLGMAFGTTAAGVGLLIGSVGLIIAALHEFDETGEVTDEMLVTLAVGLAVVGIAISLLTGNWIPALIGLVLGIGTAFGLTSDTIRDAVSSILQWVLDMWNYIKSFFDWISNAWSTLWGYQTTGTVGDLSGGISSYSMMPETPITRIPALARGAVLPANKPFLAMVGDQKSGTNVEAPLETIKQALAEVLGESGLDVDINFTGSLSQLARVLTPEITKRQRQTDRAKGG